MSKKLRVGIIGTGFGKRVHYPAFAAHPRVEVVALSSGQPGKARAMADSFGVPYAFDQYEGLVQADLDLVTVTAPPALHRPMVLAALLAGRHVLCEKPMALSVPEAEEMLGAAQQAGRVHVIDHEVRFNPNRRKMKALIAEGFIGQPRHALLTQVSSARADPTRRYTWWHDRTRGGGLLGAYGSHQIDLLRYLLGEVAGLSPSAGGPAATGMLSTFITHRQEPGGGPRPVTADDFATFSLRFACGAIGVVLLSVVATHQRGPRLEIWGDEGSLFLEADERLFGGRRGAEVVELTEPETLALPKGMDYDPVWGKAFVRLVDHLAQAILDGSDVAPAATFHDGLAVQRTLCAIEQAARCDPR
jgi:predicted dehydrogenase